MDQRTVSDPGPARALLDGFSLEMTAKDTDAIAEAAPLIPPGTRVHLTFLANEDTSMRVDAAQAIAELGLRPVPHLAARQLRSAAELEEILASLAAAGAATDLCLIGGDPSTPEGPFDSALSVIESGALTRHGVRGIAIAGYPDGHPDIATHVLWEHLELKLAALREQDIDAVIATQFSFDADAVAAWVREVRERGITAPIRVGTPGPVSAKRLLGFARRFGISANAMVVRKYGFSLTALVGRAGPDRFVIDLASRLDELDAGEVDLHFYTFGGLHATAEWVSDVTTHPGRPHTAAATN